MQFSPYFKPTTLINKKGTTTRAVPLLLVRMTGFEPTRISSLEPETSASAVPPHPLLCALNFYTGRAPEAVLTIQIKSYFSAYSAHLDLRLVLKQIHCVLYHSFW